MPSGRGERKALINQRTATSCPMPAATILDATSTTSIEMTPTATEVISAMPIAFNVRPKCHWAAMGTKNTNAYRTGATAIEAHVVRWMLSIVMPWPRAKNGMTTQANAATNAPTHAARNAHRIGRGGIDRAQSWASGRSINVAATQGTKPNPRTAMLPT